MRIVDKSILVYNTVKYLRPVQLMNQVAVRIRPKELFWKYRKKDIEYTEYNLWISGLDDNFSYVKRFKADGILKDQLTLLNETRSLGKWRYDDAAHLWQFNLHYLEYLIPMISAWNENGDDRYIEKAGQILEDWYQNGSMEPDSNHAYTVSLRVVNQLIIAPFVKEKRKLYDSIYAQYRFLINHQEKHLMGNHYFENLKAIVICSVVFGEEDIYKRYIAGLFKELEEEISPDGLHFELSTMYHKIVLEDLIRVATVLQQAGKEEHKRVAGYIQKMCSALYSLEDGISRTLLFNDAGDNVAKPTDSLLSVCERMFNIYPSKSSLVSGYSILSDGKIRVVEDCGALSPSYMPGHAHCDCLSFELFYNGQPVFVNSGTFQYQGPYRQYFRSTKAHNTVVINGHEQSELWGEHRAGRRIRVLKNEQSERDVTGEYKNYYGERHKRYLRLMNSTLFISDTVSGSAESYFHFAPGFKVSGNKILGNGLEIRVDSGNIVSRVEQTLYSDEFGKTEPNECLVFEWENDGKERTLSFEICEAVDSPAKYPKKLK